MDTKNPTHFKAHDLPAHHSIKKQRSSNVFWIILVCVIFLLFLLWNKRSQIIRIFENTSSNTSVSTGMVIGETVSMEGQLSQDGDFITHTHKLYTLSSGIFGLKSKTVNLNMYSGTITVEGVVDSERDGLYIIDVNNVISQVVVDTGAQLSGSDLTAITSQGVYLTKAGVYFSPGFENEFVLQNSGENGQINILHTTTNQTIKISYFVCKKGDDNNDCAQLQNTFKEANEKTFSTANGDVFYKLAEVNSWFVNNPGMFGYFINDIPEQEVIALSNYMVLPSAQYVQSTVVPQISNICKEGDVVMTNSTKSNVYLEKGVPVLKVSGNRNNGTADCKIQLDLASSAGGSLLEFKYKDTSMSGQLATGQNVIQPVDTTPVVNDKPLTVEAGVKQFAITLDKTLEFTSSRGHKIIFPSRKISFESSNISNDLGVKGISCYVQTNVIEYANKALINESPTVKIYECKVKAGIEVSSDYTSLKLDDGRVFVMEAVDPAWVDFANNVQVVLNN